MRKLLVLILFCGLVSFGCSQATKPKTEKKPDTAKKDTGPAKTEPGAKAGEITLTIEAVEVEEGKDIEKEIKIVRKDYKDGVTLEFDAATAEGVKVDPAKVELKPGEDSAKVKVTATGKDVKEFKGDFDVKKK